MKLCEVEKNETKQAQHKISQPIILSFHLLGGERIDVTPSEWPSADFILFCHVCQTGTITLMDVKLSYGEKIL